MSHRLILCDYGGVLAEDHLIDAEISLASKFDTSVSDLRNAITERSSQGANIRKNNISLEKFWSLVTLELTGQNEPPLLPKKLTELWFAAYRLRDRLVKGILTLPDSKLAIATNCDLYRLQHMKNQMGKISHDIIFFSSCDIGFIKPEKEYFDHILKHTSDMGFKEVYFCDDRKEHVDAFTKSLSAHPGIKGMAEVFHDEKIFLDNLKREL